MKYLLAVLIFFSGILAPLQAQEAKDSSLTLKSSSVIDGETDVNPTCEIHLVFSKNISNITVKENNLTCFFLTGTDGEIPLTVELADDQLQRDKRNDALLKPAGLADAQKYTLTVSTNLTSKNGSTLEENLVIHFSTPGYRNPNRGRFPVVLFVPIVVLFISIAYFVNQRHAK